MKKITFCFLAVFIFLASFVSVIAGPEEVELLPTTKWGYIDVDGYGFYALNGEFSWFAFVLHNPSDNDYTVSLPTEVDVNHASHHKTVNTAYKVMNDRGTDFFNDHREKIYFTGDLTLPKHSTYAIYMDITEIQAYSGQWDVQTFMTIQIRDDENSASIEIEGILARDGYNEVPTKLVIVVPGAPDLQTVNFCRDYSEADQKVIFTYTLKNIAHDRIKIKPATTLSIEGFQQTLPIQYTECIIGGTSYINSLSSTAMINLVPSQSIELRGEVSLPQAPTNPDFLIKTFLRYDYNGKTMIPYLIGETTTSCSVTPPTPAVTETVTAEPVIPTETEAPVITTTPEAPETEILESLGICRTYDNRTNKVSFNYSIRNKTSRTIPVELATTIAVEGQNNTLPIRNMTCSGLDGSCTGRISDGYLNLNGFETVTISGEIPLQNAPEKSDFYIKTSLRYKNVDTMVPLLIGYATTNCPASPVTPEPTEDPVITETPAPTAIAPLITTNFCKVSGINNRKTGFVYSLRNDGIDPVSVELATTMAVEGLQRTVPIRYLNCTGNNGSCIGRIMNGRLTLNVGETAELRGEITLPTTPDKSNYTIRTSLRYDYNGEELIPFYIGTTADYCAAAHSVAAAEETAQYEDILAASYTLINDTDYDQTIAAGTIILNGKEIQEYIGSAIHGSLDGTTESRSSLIFGNGESIVLPPQSAADITLSFVIDNANETFADEAVRWNYNTVEETEDSESISKSETIPENSSGDNVVFYYIGYDQGYDYAPGFPER